MKNLARNYFRRHSQSKLMSMTFLFALFIGSAYRSFGQSTTSSLVGQNLWMTSYHNNGVLQNAYPQVSALNLEIIRLGGHGYNDSYLGTTAYDDLLDDVESLGATPSLQIGSYWSIAQCTDLLSHLKNTGRNVTYFSVGNEPDNKEGWDVFNVQDYITKFSDRATLIRQYYPNAIISGGSFADVWSLPIVRNIIPFFEGTRYLKDSNGKYLLNVFDYHNYNGCYSSANVPTWDVSKIESDWTANIKANLDIANANRPADQQLSWSMSEFHTTYNNDLLNVQGTNFVPPSTHKTYSFFAGQFFTMMYGFGMKNGAAYMMPWALHESSGSGSYGDLGIFDGAGPFVPRSTYYHIQMFAQNKKANYITNTSNKTDVETVAMSDATGVTVFVLNTRTNTYTLSLSLNNTASTASLAVNVNAGIAKTISDNIEAETTLAFVFDSAGNLIKKISYSKANTDAGAVPTSTTYAVVPKLIPATIQAEDYSAYNNAQPTQMRVATTDAGGGSKMGYNDPGDWYEYSINVPTAGSYNVDFRVANGATTTGQFTLTNGTTNLTTVDVAPTGAWETFVTISKPISFTTTGVKTIRLTTVASGVDYNWFNITMPVNAAPSVSLTAPAANSSYSAPASITITATAADTDGSISKVEFYDGTTLLGTDTSSPYSFSWTNVAAGSHSITARAYDNLNLSTPSAAITVTVVTPVLTSIAVSPSNSTVTKGAVVDFNATGYDQLGNAMTSSINEGWTITGGGTINSSNGILTTTTGGNFTVSCSNMSVGTEVFTDPSFDNGLTSWTVAAYNGAVGTTTAANSIVSQSVTTAGADSWNYRLMQAANLTVQNYVLEVRVRAITTTRNIDLIFEKNATPYTRLLTVQETVPTTWTVYSVPFSNTVADNVRAGIYDGNSVGAIEVDYISLKTASVAGVTGTTNITINEPTPVLTSIAITPASATTTAGSIVSFSAQGYDQTAATMTATYIWSTTAGSAITSAGVFSSTTSGTYTVTATSGLITKTATVTVGAAALSTITLTPTTATKTAGTTQQYSAAGKDAYNNTVAITPTWTVSGGGTISSGGLFTATTAGGPFTVTATSGTKTGTAQVTVSAGALSNITLTPATATITAGTTQQYTAAGKDTYNNTVAITPIWTVSGGGTISSGGLFTANTAGGPYTVTATSGTKTGTAQVTVSAPAIYSGGVYTIISKYNARAIGVGNPSTANGSNVLMWDAVGSQDQKWELIGQTDGTFLIRNANSNKVMDIAGWAWNNYGNVQQWDSNFSNNQKFWITTFNGGYQIISNYNWRVLTVQDWAWGNGGNVCMYDNQWYDHQIWYFTPVLKSATLDVEQVNRPEANVSVYPSPVSDMLHINGVAGFDKVKVFNSLGQLINTYQKSNEVLFSIDVRSLKSGIYLIELSNEKEKITKKVIKK
jgi:hypothetical protein